MFLKLIWAVFNVTKLLPNLLSILFFAPLMEENKRTKICLNVLVQRKTLSTHKNTVARLINFLSNRKRYKLCVISCQPKI